MLQYNKSDLKELCKSDTGSGPKRKTIINSSWKWS